MRGGGGEYFNVGFVHILFKYFHVLHKLNYWDGLRIVSLLTYPVTNDFVLYVNVSVRFWDYRDIIHCNTRLSTSFYSTKEAEEWF